MTARELSLELEIGERTIYRDISDLVASGVPIQAEAGVGYRLPRGGFDLPPLMFTEDEIQALVLGARVVKSWGDPALARAAEDVLTKVEAVLPARLKNAASDAPLFALNFREDRLVTERLGAMRAAVLERRKVEIEYCDQNGRTTTRTIEPLALFYWAPHWTVGAFCELRGEFRNFRIDRITRTQVTEERFTPAPGRTLSDLFAYNRDTTREKKHSTE